MLIFILQIIKHQNADQNIKNTEKVNIKTFCIKLKPSDVHDRLCIKLHWS